MKFEDQRLDLTRQLDLIPLDKLSQKIHIIGAGAIGGFTALSLAKMGFTNLTVFDDDTVDIENMNCQFFRHTDIGKPKVLALQGLIKDFTGAEIEVINDRWSDTKLDGIVITAVDSMAVRKQVFEAHFKKSFNTDLIIDPRMGSETCMLFAYNPLSPSEGDEYTNSLYSDEDALQERCTAKATVYSVLGISSMVAATVKRYTCNEKQYKSCVNYHALMLDLC